MCNIQTGIARQPNRHCSPSNSIHVLRCVYLYIDTFISWDFALLIWHSFHFIFAWNTTIPHCYCFCCWSSFVVTHQTSTLLVVSVQSKDLPPVASSDVTACFPDWSRSAITVEWVIRDCLFFRMNRQHPWTWQLAFPIDHALPQLWSGLPGIVRFPPKPVAASCSLIFCDDG